MPGGLEKRRLDGVCACAPPLEAAPAAAMVIAAAMTLRREAGVAESNSEIMACSLVKLVGRMSVADRCGLAQLLFCLTALISAGYAHCRLGSPRSRSLKCPHIKTPAVENRLRTQGG